MRVLSAPAGTLIASAVVLALAGCDRARPPDKSAGRPTSAPARAVVAEAQTVRPERIAVRVPIVGTLFAADEVVVGTKVSGILRHTAADVGSAVEPGELLAEIDAVDYETAVREAEAALTEVLARLGVDRVPDDTFDLTQVSVAKRAAAQLENARFSYERLRGVETMIASQELSDAAARLRVAEADYDLAVDEAAALVATARERRAQLDAARQKLSDARIRVPAFPSTLGSAAVARWYVAERLVTEGQYINVAQPLYRLIVSDPLELRTRVPERYMGHVRIGQDIVLRDLSGATELRGRIVRISPAVEPASRTFEVEAVVANPDEALKAGAFAKGEIRADAASRFSVPAEAVRSENGVAYVFVLQDGRPTPRRVEVGQRIDQRVEIVGGLHGDEEIAGRALAAVPLETAPAR